MAPSFDDGGSLSGLLCVEDNNSVFLLDDNESPRAVDSSGAQWGNQGGGFGGVGEDGRDGRMSEMLMSVERLGRMLEKESEYMPGADYVDRLKSGDLDIGARKEALDWIRKVHTSFRFGLLSAYLSISYFDRFISAHDLPNDKPWMTQLLAVACLSVAVKLEEVDVPLSLDLQVEGSKYVFEPRTVKRMELLVMYKLSWRLQTVTPFSFIDHFLRMIIGDKIPSKASILKSTQIISSTIKVIELLEFKPSDIAAAVAISVEGESRTVDSKAVLILSQHVERERVLKCIRLIHDNVLTSGSTKGASTVTVSQSPIGVLEASSLSYKSDERTFSYCDDSSNDDPPQKKRIKIER